MKVLAIDTSSSVCSVAVLEDGKILKEMHNISEKEHSQTLMPMIKELLESLNLQVEDMDLLACGIGPGSFTGIRIGIATVKAFSDSKNIPVVGINSLEALAHYVIDEKGTENCKILSMLDAKNYNTYFAVYRMHNENLTVYKNPEARHISDVVKYLNFQEPVYLVGECFLDKIETLLRSEISREKAESKEVCRYECIEEIPPLAVYIAKAAITRYKRGTYGDSNTISPMYLRKPQAERQKEGLEDEDVYILPMTVKDKEEIKTKYKQFPNLWTYTEFDQDSKYSKYNVAKQNNEIIGFIATRQVLDEIEIVNVVTRNDKRNQGVASNMLSHIIRNSDANKINLEVNEKNIIAKNLYSKFGFIEVGKRPKYYKGQDDAILMSL